MIERNSKRHSRRIFWGLTGFVIVVFIGILSFPSAYTKALQELKVCSNEYEVKKVWDKYAESLREDEPFVLEVREKVAGFFLSQPKIDSCLSWLPKTPMNVNVIIVLDLSERLVDTLNFPNQKKRDKEMIHAIYKAFVSFVGKKSTKDKMSVVISNFDGKDDLIRNNLDKLYLNMVDEINSPVDTFFNDYQKDKFRKSIDYLYNFAIDNPVKSNFYAFCNSDLSNCVEESTLFDRYRNKFFILTDGRINNDAVIFQSKGVKNELLALKDQEEGMNFFSANDLNVELSEISLANTDVMIYGLDRHANKTGNSKGLVIGFWQNWFEQKGVSLVEVIPMDIPLRMIENRVETFMQKGSN